MNEGKSLKKILDYLYQKVGFITGLEMAQQHLIRDLNLKIWKCSITKNMKLIIKDKEIIINYICLYGID